jgi:hypothetical protein
MEKMNKIINNIIAITDINQFTIFNDIDYNHSLVNLSAIVMLISAGVTLIGTLLITAPYGRYNIIDV